MNATQRNGYSNFDPMAISMSAENDIAAKSQSSLSFNVSWPSTQSSTVMEGDVNGVLPTEPSPVDWEQW
jgi:hypothetical protein